MLHVARYIFLNPVRAGLCEEASQWRWSSYDAVIKDDAPLPFLATAQILAEFGEPPGARERFVAFVKAGIGEEDPCDIARLRTCIGSDDFIARAARLAGEASLEVPRKERACKTLEQYAAEATRQRDAIRAAYSSGTYSMNEIATHFGLHAMTVSRILRRPDWRATPRLLESET